MPTQKSRDSCPTCEGGCASLQLQHDGARGGVALADAQLVNDLRQQAHDEHIDARIPDIHGFCWRDRDV